MVQVWYLDGERILSIERGWVFGKANKILEVKSGFQRLVSTNRSPSVKGLFQ